MKFFEKIIIITFMCFCILEIKGEVMAAELQPDEELGETTYTIDNVAVWTEYISPSGYWKTTIAKGTITLIGYKACMYQEIVDEVKVDTRLIFYNKNGLSENVSYLRNGTTESGIYNGTEWYNDRHQKSSSLNWELCFRTYKTCEWSYLKTNIPIFSSQEQALEYINGTVDITQADNYEDLINITYDSTDIPTPHNLNVTEENSKYYISWSQTSEELPFISEVSYRHHIDALQITHETEGVYPTYPKKPELFYNPQLLHKYEITDEILNIVKFYREKCGVDSFKCSYVIRIRNKFVKSETEILYSNVVRVVLTISYDVNSGIKISAEYEEKTESGDFVPDSSYNDYGDGSGLIRDDIGASSGGSLSTGNFLSNIVNGFGLLGGSGIVSLTASALSFIPSELWALIYFSLSLFLIIALFKLVIK